MASKPGIATVVASVLMVTWGGWQVGSDGVDHELDREVAQVGFDSAVAAGERPVEGAFEGELLGLGGEPGRGEGASERQLRAASGDRAVPPADGPGSDTALAAAESSGIDAKLACRMWLNNACGLV
jgi:hypothetical protein